MPIGPDTDRQGSTRADRSSNWNILGNAATLLRAGEQPNDLGDLVDPQDDTYEEEGTHGLPLLAAAARPLLGKMAGAAATSFGMTAGSNIANKLTSDGGK